MSRTKRLRRRIRDLENRLAAVEQRMADMPQVTYTPTGPAYYGGTGDWLLPGQTFNQTGPQ